MRSSLLSVTGLLSFLDVQETNNKIDAIKKMDDFID
jgi:hypothetical protein